MEKTQYLFTYTRDWGYWSLWEMRSFHGGGHSRMGLFSPFPFSLVEKHIRTLWSCWEDFWTVWKCSSLGSYRTLHEDIYEGLFPSLSSLFYLPELSAQEPCTWHLVEWRDDYLDTHKIHSKVTKSKRNLFNLFNVQRTAGKIKLK